MAIITGLIGAILPEQKHELIFQYAR